MDRDNSSALSGSPIETSESVLKWIFMNFGEFEFLRENFSRITQNGFLLTWCSIYIVLLLSAYGDHWINSNTLLLSYFSQLLEQCLMMVLITWFKNVIFEQKSPISVEAFSIGGRLGTGNFKIVFFELSDFRWKWRFHWTEIKIMNQIGWFKELNKVKWNYFRPIEWITALILSILTEIESF